MSGLAAAFVLILVMLGFGAYEHAVGYSAGSRHAWAMALNEVSRTVPVTDTMLPRAQAWSDSAYSAHFGGFWQSVWGNPR